jgi:aspartate/methionine/tyrosine aminotransferase
VAALNGGAFGDYGEGYIRLSYANSLENLMEAVARIEKAAVRWAAVGARG